MSKNRWIALLAALAFVSTTWALIVTLHLLQQEAPAVESTPSRVAATESFSRDIGQLTAGGSAETELLETNRKLEQEVRNLRAEVSILQVGRSPAPSLSGGRVSAVPTTSRAMLAHLLADPATVGEAMDLIKADQSQRYAALFAQMSHLSPAQQAELRHLLAERYATRNDLAMLGGQSALSAAEQEQLTQEYRRRLVALVGEADAELFERVETKHISWDRIQRLDERLRYAESPLDKQQLVELWPIVSNGIFYYRPPQNEAALTALIQRRETANAQVLANARRVLNTRQYAALEQVLRDDTAAWRVQMRAMVLAARTAPGS
jgi:hypothetical protein